VFRFGDHYTWEQLNPLLDTLRTMATKYEVPVSAIALNWVISKGCIPLGGARNAKQAEENAKATLFRLSDDDVKVLDGMAFEGKTCVFASYATCQRELC
jgi:aryl-alcohol dehydrogenase-like predicted oxidoreductase